MGCEESHRLAILVVDEGGDLLSHARAEFRADHVVSVGTPGLAISALAQIDFDVVLCRPRDVCRLPADERVLPVGRLLKADEVLGVISHALMRRARKARQGANGTRSCGCC